MPTNSSEQKTEWLLIGLLLSIMIVKGVMWSLAFPLWQGPDEDDHYAVIQFIGETGRLPDENDLFLPDEVTMSRALADVGRIPYEPEQRQLFSQSDVGPGELALAELDPALRATFDLAATGKLMHATPLYYFLASTFYRLAEDGDILARAQNQRLLSVTIGSLMVVVAYLIARVLFPTNRAMRITIPTLVAFHPMITEITAVVSVDGLLILCYTTLIYLSLLVIRDGFNWHIGVSIGLVFAIGFLTKPTLSGFAPLIALLLIFDFVRGKYRRRQIVAGVGLMAVIILVPMGWWMSRSLRLNDDLFYFNPVLEGHRIIDFPFFDYAFFKHMVDYYQSVWGGIFVTWWAHFGWLDTALPPWVYTLLRLLVIIAIAGLALRLFRGRTIPFVSAKWVKGQETAPLSAWLFLALSILVPIVLLQIYDITFWWEYGVGRGLQGRYWLGTVVPMLSFFATGLLLWVPRRWQNAGHLALRSGMVVLNFVSMLAFIVPRYYL